MFTQIEAWPPDVRQACSMQALSTLKSHGAVYAVHTLLAGNA
jgi:hypothetical protein